METLSIGNLVNGMKARIVGYADGNPAYRAKLLALGLTRGVEVCVVNQAPFGDPVAIQVRGFNLSLRRAEAAVVQVTPL